MRQPIPFGKYLLLERINVGGMAEIFLARSRGVGGFKRILAIKKILPTMAEDEEFIAMFIDEARIAAELSHAGIVQIFELGKFEEDYYIAMEFVHGKDLRYIQERLAREQRPLDVQIAAHVAFKICEALDYAHTKRDPTGRPLGIIHRDISPQNVILSYEGEVKICDFGIAKAANRSQKTQAGVLKGKFGYMSPEQVRGLPLDGRSDIFTVGTLLYELITLERLFLGESDFSTLEKVRNADVVPPSTYNREVPEELEDIVLKALAKDVEDRYQGAAEMADALQLFMINSKLSSSRDLSRFMRDSFQPEFEAELRRLEEYQEMPEPQLLATPTRDSQAGDEETPAVDGDPDAKTLIFASSDQEADGSQPPPLPPRTGAEQPADQQPQLVDAKTQIFEENRQAELGDAKTMIFADSAAEAAADLHEAPTMLPRARPDIPPPAAARGPRTPRSLAERLFFPLSLALALLLGYSVFATIRLVRQAPAEPGPPVFELTSEPSTGVRVYLDGDLLSEGTPWTSSSLAPGDHRLRLSRSGFDDLERDVRLQPGQRLVMEVALRRDGATSRRPTAIGRPEVDGGDGRVDAGQQEASGAADGGPGPDGAAGPDAGPAARPAVAAGPAKAALIVETNPPGAKLQIDGHQVGSTPWTGQAAIGEVRLQARLRGYHPARQTIRIQADRKNEVRLTLAKRVVKPAPKPPPKPKPKPVKKEIGYLLANTRPWSKVYVDGKSTGRETPIPPDKRLKLAAGKHRITFEVPGGKRYDFDVVIEPGQTLKLIKRLE